MTQNLRQPREHANAPIKFSSENNYVSIRLRPVDQENTEIPAQDIISLLEQYEKQLAIHYEMASGTTPDVDSVAVFQEARARAMRKKDSSSVQAYQFLHQLYRIRLRFHYKSITSPFLAKQDSPSTIEPPLEVERSRFWAVIIGIDAYDSYPLQGCVSDATSMEKYLKEDLGVPQERIQLLLGSEHSSSEDPSFPSRVNIVNTLLGLIDNPQIEVGDNIVIYFSGHGSGYFSDASLYRDADSEEDDGSAVEVDRSIETICPIDRDTFDASGLRVPDISDREINAVFQQICRSKGHRITFILDCCHSGGHIRHFPEPGTRTIPPLPRASLQRMLHMADGSLGRYPTYKSILATDWRPDMSSHVVLTACKEYQTAREVETERGYGGIFTHALIGTLRTGNLSEESTYVDLLFSLPRKRGQTPVVAGKHKRERLWYKD
ncbi:uncharacterized protein BT62DRAFT_955400 [Guyanagaster necrorhizus]|uniref:Peptidase C14 caspase domain-containing protein n=1 Tax=Guyanagaster necrorhizus TaxID=856835 RepID=A0A9P8APM0_9AGAR|nr:uncharacterized protein BT62DRAFT_955400 [Guyanagaster necrorhizus MCA 3950]KAG7442012.1 hypothetical protein BT62DRAFT_955400 [Guyanagaster necrorhizus MCA 3950]